MYRKLLSAALLMAATYSADARPLNGDDLEYCGNTAGLAETAMKHRQFIDDLAHANKINQESDDGSPGSRMVTSVLTALLADAYMRPIEFTESAKTQAVAKFRSDVQRQCLETQQMAPDYEAKRTPPRPPQIPTNKIK